MNEDGVKGEEHQGLFSKGDGARRSWGPLRVCVESSDLGGHREKPYPTPQSLVVHTRLERNCTPVANGTLMELRDSVKVDLKGARVIAQR